MVKFGRVYRGCQAVFIKISKNCLDKLVHLKEYEIEDLDARQKRQANDTGGCGK